MSTLYAIAEANAAASEGRHQGWMQHLNRYLDPSDVSTVERRPGWGEKPAPGGRRGRTLRPRSGPRLYFIKRRRAPRALAQGSSRAARTPGACPILHAVPIAQEVRASPCSHSPSPQETHGVAEIWVEAVGQARDAGGDFVKVDGLTAAVPLEDVHRGNLERGRGAYIASSARTEGGAELESGGGSKGGVFLIEEVLDRGLGGFNIRALPLP